jgi:hypothetical protein
MMKMLTYMLLGILFVLAMAGCQSEVDLGEYSIPEYSSDVIDWSLYSWQEDGEWMFSIVDRYGGYETFEEISADEFKLPNLDYLLEALVHLPENSEVLWTEYIIPGTELPPQELVLQILDYCNSIGVPVIVLN